MSQENRDKSVNYLSQEDDPTAVSRKQDHIEMAFRSQVQKDALDRRFYYEPLLSAHPEPGSYPTTQLLGKTFKVPVWVSSMTGGTALARTINQNLARACKDFGMGMGLGSCRALLYSDEYLEDFAVRKYIGDDQAFYANLGIAQIEQLIEKKELYRIDQLIEKLAADGLIIHVNPFQEWLQPEGDVFKKSPLETIETVLSNADYSIIVKEVGQGMGYESLKALFQLPLAAVEFAANGGTNFAKLELMRSDEAKKEVYSQLANVGHSAADMVNIVNRIKSEMADRMQCNEVIISGGIGHFLDGYYLINKLAVPSVYGQASQFLKYARGDYDTLYQYIQSQVEGLALANAYLRVRDVP